MCFVFLSFCIPQSAICTPQSKHGGGLMLWIMGGPERGKDLNDELRMKSFELKSKIRNVQSEMEQGGKIWLKPLRK